MREISALLLFVALTLLASGCATMKQISPRQHSRFPGDESLPNLVFIHGVYHDSWAFENFKKSFLHHGYPCSLIDLRGHKIAPRVKPNSQVGYKEYLADVADTLDEIHGGKVLVGHSLGGLLALSLSERKDVLGNVLISTPLPAAVRNKQLRLIAEHPINSTRFLLTGNAANLYHDTRFTDRYFFSKYTSTQAKASAHERIHRQHEPAQLFRDVMTLKFESPGRVVPTLIVLGSEDPTVTSSVGVQLQRLTSGTIVTVPEAGHDIMLEDTSEIAANKILDWLSMQKW